MYEGLPQGKKEKIEQLCLEKGIEVINDCADLTNLSFTESMDFFKSLLQSGEVVLHGTNSNEAYSCLEAKQGHCVVKESGRKIAVYATESPRVALAISVLNRDYLRDKFVVYASAYSGNNDMLTFKFPPKIYELFVKHDPNIFADGYVYVLNKENFVNAAGAGAEWHSESDQEPILACRVSKTVADNIYIVGDENRTVFEGDFKNEP